MAQRQLPHLTRDTLTAPDACWRFSPGSIFPRSEKLALGLNLSPVSQGAGPVHDGAGVDPHLRKKLSYLPWLRVLLLKDEGLVSSPAFEHFPAIGAQS